MFTLDYRSSKYFYPNSYRNFYARHVLPDLAGGSSMGSLVSDIYSGVADRITSLIEMEIAQYSPAQNAEAIRKINEMQDMFVEMNKMSQGIRQMIESIFIYSNHFANNLRDRANVLFDETIVVINAWQAVARPRPNPIVQLNSFYNKFVDLFTKHEKFYVTTKHFSDNPKLATKKDPIGTFDKLTSASRNMLMYALLAFGVVIILPKIIGKK